LRQVNGEALQSGDARVVQPTPVRPGSGRRHRVQFVRARSRTVDPPRRPVC